MDKLPGDVADSSSVAHPAAWLARAGELFARVLDSGSIGVDSNNMDVRLVLVLHCHR